MKYKSLLLLLLITLHYLNAGSFSVLLKNGSTVKFEISDVRNIYFTDINSSSIQEAAKIANMQIMLLKNYPNPFNPSTNIEFDLSSGGLAELIVYNQNGQVVEKIFDGEMSAGHHNFMWNGQSRGGSQYSSGVYFYKLTVNGECKINKMIMCK